MSHEFKPVWIRATDRSDKILSQRRWFSHVTRGDLLQQSVAATCRSDLSHRVSRPLSFSAKQSQFNFVFSKWNSDSATLHPLDIGVLHPPGRKETERENLGIPRLRKNITVWAAKTLCNAAGFCGPSHCKSQRRIKPEVMSGNKLPQESKRILRLLYIFLRARPVSGFCVYKYTEQWSDYVIYFLPSAPVVFLLPAWDLTAHKKTGRLRSFYFRQRSKWTLRRPVKFIYICHFSLQ